MYGVSPHPGQAPENSISGLKNWLPLTEYLSITFSFGFTVMANSQFSDSISISCSAGFIIRALPLAGHMSAQLAHPVQSKGETCILQW